MSNSFIHKTRVNPQADMGTLFTAYTDNILGNLPGHMGVYNRKLTAPYENSRFLRLQRRPNVLNRLA